jgi:uncharacterized membrane protein YuzA (DUF378 family)
VNYTMNNFSTWLAVVMLVIFTTMVGLAFTYPTGARFMPLVVGIPGLVLCLLQLVQDYLRSRKSSVLEHFHSQPQAGTPVAPAGESEEQEFGPHTVRNEITMWVYLVGYITSILLFGFLISIPILVALYLHFEAKASRLVSIIAGLASVTVVYFLFEYILRFKLHEGFVTSQVIKSLGL